LFATSNLGESLSMLGEFVFEAHEGGTGFELERIQLAWDASDSLRLSFGRGHTRLGYWNHRFHHGSYLQTTIDRPAIYGFEDGGGFLPIHFVGIEASGTLPSEAGVLTYALTFANGRGREPDRVEDAVDSNRGKLAMLSLAFEPEVLPGLTLGANFGHDLVPGGGDPRLTSSFDEWIYGGHVAFVADRIEAIAEAQWVRHGAVGTAPRAASAGGYLQLAYQVSSWKPYYRFDWIARDADDAWFSLAPELEDTLSHVLGLRFDWRSHAALKIELSHGAFEGEDVESVRSQLSYGF
jgi:hypothetical protein